MPKFAELQILLDAGMNIGIFDNFNCQEYEMAYVEDGKWIGQDGNNKYDDSTYHAVFEINRNPIETVSDSIFKTDSSPTLSAVKGEDFTWQGNCDIEISYYNSDKTICDSAPAAAGDRTGQGTDAGTAGALLDPAAEGGDQRAGGRIPSGTDHGHPADRGAETADR